MNRGSDAFEERVEAAIQALRDLGELVTPDGRLNAKGAAALIGVRQKTLRNWRSEGVGPTSFVAGQVWYRTREIVRWLDEQEQSV